MLRFKAKFDALSTVDYYCRDQALLPHERVGQWHGKACQFMGIATNDPLKPEQFYQALQGYGVDGYPIISRFRSGRRIAFDGALSADKTFSVVGLCLSEQLQQQIRTAWIESVQETFVLVESLAHCRRQAAKKTEKVASGNLAVAHFVHEASRHNDPHLHSHLIILNSTRDEREVPALSRWSALEPRLMFQCKKAIDHLFQHSLAKRLYRMGIQLAYRGLTPFIPALDAIAKQFQKAHDKIKKYVDRYSLSHQVQDKEAFDNVANDKTRPTKKQREPDYFRSLLDPETKEQLIEGIQAPSESFDREISYNEIVDLIRERVGQKTLIPYRPDLLSAMTDVLPQAPLVDAATLIRAAQDADQPARVYGWGATDDKLWHQLQKNRRRREQGRGGQPVKAAVVDPPFPATKQQPRRRKL